MSEETKRTKFIGLGLVSGPGRYTEPASLGFDRGLKDERLDFARITDAQLLSLVHEASAYLDLKAKALADA